VDVVGIAAVLEVWLRDASPAMMFQKQLKVSADPWMTFRSCRANARLPDRDDALSGSFSHFTSFIYSSLTCEGEGVEPMSLERKKDFQECGKRVTSMHKEIVA